MSEFDAAAYTEQSKRDWSAAAPFYDRLSADLFPTITKAFLSFARPRRAGLLLDVACGPGILTYAACEAVCALGRVGGIDLSPGMLKLAASRAGASNVEFREMNAEQLDFPDATFDAVVCQLGLMLFAKPQSALDEMARVCKKGGVVACLVQGSPERMQFTSLLMKTLVKHAPQLKQPGSPTLYAFAPAGVLEESFAAAGLPGATTARLAGAFTFASPKEYWQTLTQGAGRTASLLRALDPSVQEAIRRETLAAAAALTAAGTSRIPYEVVMARAERA